MQYCGSFPPSLVADFVFALSLFLCLYLSFFLYLYWYLCLSFRRQVELQLSANAVLWLLLPLPRGCPPSHNRPIYGRLEAAREWGLENREIYEIGQLLFHNRCHTETPIAPGYKQFGIQSGSGFKSFGKKLKILTQWESLFPLHFGEV